jgi:hypothetical protein
MVMAESNLSPLLQTALNAIRSTTDGMTAEQLAWHPEAKWSSAEILEHLSLAYSRTVERMAALLEQGAPEVRRRTFREWIGGLIVLKLERIPPGRKAPEAISPRGIAADQALTSAQSNLAELDRMIDRCQQRFGTQQNIMAHAILGPLTTSEWRKFHYVHTIHHMRQVKALRQRMAASASAAANAKG